MLLGELTGLDFLVAFAVIVTLVTVVAVFDYWRPKNRHKRQSLSRLDHWTHSTEGED